MTGFPSAGETRGFVGPTGCGRVPRAGRELLARHARGRDARSRSFAGRASEPDYTRAFALDLLGSGATPAAAIPITGITMNLPKRDAKLAAEALKAVGVGGVLGVRRRFAGGDAGGLEAGHQGVRPGDGRAGARMPSSR